MSAKRSVCGELSMIVGCQQRMEEIRGNVVKRRLDSANSINGGYVNRHLTSASPETELIQGKETPRLCSALEGPSADIGGVSWLQVTGSVL